MSMIWLTFHLICYRVTASTKGSCQEDPCPLAERAAAIFTTQEAISESVRPEPGPGFIDPEAVAAAATPVVPGPGPEWAADVASDGEGGQAVYSWGAEKEMSRLRQYDWLHPKSSERDQTPSGK